MLFEFENCGSFLTFHGPWRLNFSGCQYPMNFKLLIKYIIFYVEKQFTKLHSNETIKSPLSTKIGPLQILMIPHIALIYSYSCHSHIYHIPHVEGGIFKNFICIKISEKSYCFCNKMVTHFYHKVINVRCFDTVKLVECDPTFWIITLWFSDFRSLSLRNCMMSQCNLTHVFCGIE